MSLQEANTHIIAAKGEFDKASEELHKGASVGWKSQADLSGIETTLEELQPQIQGVADKARSWGSACQDARTALVAGHAALEGALDNNGGGESTGYLEEARTISSVIYTAQDPESDLMEASARMAEYRQIVSGLPQRLEGLLEELRRAKVLVKEMADIEHGSSLGADSISAKLEHWQHFNHLPRE